MISGRFAIEEHLEEHSALGLLRLYKSNSGDLISFTLGGGQVVTAGIKKPWSARPLPSEYVGFMWVPDVGIHGTTWWSDGNTWGLVGGSAILRQSAVAAAALTGTTTETTDTSFYLFGGLLGPNGELEVNLKYTHTNDANTKTRRLRLGGTGITGTILGDPQSSSNLTTHVGIRIENRNSEASQLGSNGTVNYTGSSNAWKTGTVDTTVDQLVAVTTQLGNSGNSSVMEAYQFILRRP